MLTSSTPLQGLYLIFASFLAVKAPHSHDLMHMPKQAANYTGLNARWLQRHYLPAESGPL